MMDANRVAVRWFILRNLGCVRVHVRRVFGLEMVEGGKTDRSSGGRNDAEEDTAIGVRRRRRREYL